MKQATVRFALLPALLLAAGCLSPSGGSSAGDKPVISITGEGAELRAEVVSTPASREHGLMFRTSLGADEGMLFVYPKKAALAFWMKNTPLPLSIAFIDDDGTIVNTEDMAPADEGPRYRSLKPVRYALEVNQGWFVKHGLGPGRVLRFQIPEGLEIR